MKSFAHRFTKLIEEDMIAGEGGAFGSAPSMSHGGEVPGGSDWYAPQDARVPSYLGSYTRKGLIKKRRKKRKKK